jgi:hypothetical protein
MGDLPRDLGATGVLSRGQADSSQGDLVIPNWKGISDIVLFDLLVLFGEPQG